MAKAPAKSKTASKVEPVQSIVAYKAFDQNLACRGFQYEVGKTFEMSGEPSICKRGFHACENPFDVFNYYPLGSRVARVTLTGTVDRHGDENQDSKICGVRLTVDAELRMPEIVKAAVAWIVKAAKKNVATGDSGHAAATGYSSVAASLGMGGTALAAEGGAICLTYQEYDPTKGKYVLRHIRSSMVGENGIEANKIYRLNAAGDFEQVSSI